MKYCYFSTMQNLAEIMSGPVFFQLSNNALYAALSFNLVVNYCWNKIHVKRESTKILLLFPPLQETDDVFVFIQAVFSIFASIFWMFLYCYFATQICTTLSRLGQVAYHSTWDDYPIEFRKYLILIIGRAQISPQFNGLKIFNCDMETFANVRISLCFW